MRKILVIASTLALAGCGAHVSGPSPATLMPATNNAPLFARSEFEGPADPVPPDSKHRTNADGEKFMEQQKHVIGVYRIRLQSVGRKAAAANLVR